MKSNKFIKKCGPYKVHSISQDDHGVRLEIFPAFSQYNLTPKEQAKGYIDESWAKDPRWAIHRLKCEGGGPSIFAAIALAEEFEEFLNQCYTEANVKEWKDTLAEALKMVTARSQKRFEKAMAKQEKQNETV